MKKETLFAVIGSLMLVLLLVWRISAVKVEPNTQHIDQSIPTPQVSTKPVVKEAATPQPLPTLNGGDIFGLINQYRTNNGLPAWEVSDQLCNLAEQRATYLIGNDVNFFRNTIGANLQSHPGFISTINSDTNNGSLQEDDVAENLAKDARTDSEALSLWENSAPHNALLLSKTLANGTSSTKACIATRMKDYGSMVVLEVGDR